MRANAMWKTAGAICLLMFLSTNNAPASIVTKVKSTHTFEILSITDGMGGPAAPALTITADFIDFGAGFGDGNSGGGSTTSSFSLALESISGDIFMSPGTLGVGSKITSEVYAEAEGVSPSEDAFAFINMNIKFAFSEGIGIPSATVTFKYTSSYEIEIAGADGTNSGFTGSEGFLVESDAGTFAELFGDLDSSGGNALITDMVMGEFSLTFMTADDDTVLFFDHSVDAFASGDAGAVPEPSTMIVWSMIGLGMVGGYGWRRKRQKAVAA